MNEEQANSDHATEGTPPNAPQAARTAGGGNRPFLSFLNRHRLKLLAMLFGLALALMLADAVLKGSAY